MTISGHCSCFMTFKRNEKSVEDWGIEPQTLCDTLYPHPSFVTDREQTDRHRQTTEIHLPRGKYPQQNFYSTQKFLRKIVFIMELENSYGLYGQALSVALASS